MDFDFHLEIMYPVWTSSVWDFFSLTLNEITFLSWVMGIEHDLWFAKFAIRYSKDREF